MKIKETTRVISRNIIIAFIGLIGLGLITSCEDQDNICEDCYFVDVNGSVDVVCITYDCITETPQR